MGKIIITMVDMHRIKNCPALMQIVDKQSFHYKSLVFSIRRYGLFSPLDVKIIRINGIIYYEIIDGLHRYEAAKELGYSKIEVVIHDLSITGIKEIRKYHPEKYIKMTSYEYTKQFKRLLDAHPEMSIKEIAKKINKPEFCVAAAIEYITPSSNGKKSSGTENRGSSPCGVTMKHKWPETDFQKCCIGAVEERAERTIDRDAYTDHFYGDY